MGHALAKTLYLLLFQKKWYNLKNNNAGFPEVMG